MALWNDLIPRLYRPRVVADQRSTVPSASTARQLASSSPSSLSPTPDTSMLAAMERDGGGVTKAMSAAGQDRKSHDRKSNDRKSNDLQHDSDVATDAEGGSDSDNKIPCPPLDKTGSHRTGSQMIYSTILMSPLTLKAEIITTTMAMSAAGQDRKSNDRKSNDLQHDSDVATDAEDGSNNDSDITVSFSLALLVGCILYTSSM